MLESSTHEKIVVHFCVVSCKLCTVFVGNFETSDIYVFPRREVKIIHFRQHVRPVLLYQLLGPIDSALDWVGSNEDVPVFNNTKVLMLRNVENSTL